MKPNFPSQWQKCEKGKLDICDNVTNQNVSFSFTIKTIISDENLSKAVLICYLATKAQILTEHTRKFDIFIVILGIDSLNPKVWLEFDIYWWYLTNHS